MVTILVPWAIAVATYHPSEVSAIGRIEGLTSGARFRAGRPKEWIVFWALSGSAVSAVLMELAARGVSVNTSPARFRYFQPGR
jgi:hypothetical protein